MSYFQICMLAVFAHTMRLVPTNMVQHDMSGAGAGAKPKVSAVYSVGIPSIFHRLPWLAGISTEWEYQRSTLFPVHKSAIPHFIDGTFKFHPHSPSFLPNQ